MKTRIRIRQLNCGVYVIDEAVTEDGKYITLPSRFKTKKAAEDYVFYHLESGVNGAF